MINFLKYTKLYVLISTVAILISLYSIVTFGYRYSIDFTGGTVLEYELSASPKNTDVNKIKAMLSDKNGQVRVNNKMLTIRQPTVDEKQEANLRKQLQETLKVKELKVVRFETVGPSVSREIVRTTGIAAIFASVGILLYMTFAFKKITQGLSALLAMLHDFFILIGSYSLFSHYLNAEFDTLFVTALLTTMSFSVHDTIVVFDKIREYGRISVKPIEDIANISLTETMVRSINNSLTIVLMLVPLVLIGGETIRFFATSLLVGTITGTYSSPFVATPLLVFFEKLKRRK